MERAMRYLGALCLGLGLLALGCDGETPTESGAGGAAGEVGAGGAAATGGGAGGSGGEAGTGGMAIADMGPEDAFVAPDVGLPDQGPDMGGCGDDDACPGAQRCDDGACVEPIECSDDVDCIADRICVDGACGEACDEDSDCPGARVCDLDTGRCGEPEMCFVPGDCDPGRTCLEGACVDRCPGDDACPGSQICDDDTGLCAEGPMCAAEVDCLGDRICVGGACADRCGDDADCPGTRACDLVSGLCPEPEMCFAPDDCDPGRGCIDGACAGLCDGMNPCPGGEVCDPNGQCVARCGAQNPCPGGLVCDGASGQCVVLPCQSPDDCPADLFCDRAREVCTDQPECQRDQDCGGARTCVEGACQEPEICFGPADCDPGRACVDGACIESCVNRACPGVQVCDEASGLCVESGQCGDDADCVGDRVCVAGGCIDPCREDAECPGSRACVDGRCPEPANCFSPDDCDPGRICQNLVCVDGCGDDPDCPGNQVCRGGQCAEPMVCANDLDCLGARICQNGTCEPPCAADADCPGGGRCDLATGRCGAPDGCALDADCPGALVCESGACIQPECAVDADCPESCVGRLCQPVPVACDGDAACPGEAVCAPLGACVPDGPCAADGDCVPGAPRCVGGACRPCADDADCAPAEICDEGTCFLFDGCQRDEDCPGTRSCADGQCAPAPCAGDRFDLEGGTPLALRTYDDLVLCDGATDLHIVTQPANTPLRIVVRHAPEGGDLRMIVRDDRTGEVVGFSDEPFGLERTEVPPSPQARDLLVEISGREGWSVDYRLTLEAPEALCPADDYEGLLGNDTQQRAASIVAGELDHRLCADEDWFALEVPAGLRLTANAFPTGPVDQLQMALFGPEGRRLADAVLDEETGDISLGHDVAAGGRHALQVRAPEADAAGLPNRLFVELAPAEAVAALACADQQPLAPGPGAELVPSAEVVRLPNSCGSGFGQTWIAGFRVDRAGTATLRLVGQQFAGTIAVRRDCADAESEVTCVEGDPMAIEPEVEAVVDLQPGQYTAVVEASPAGPLRLTLEIR